MLQLIRGVHQFQQDFFRDHKELFEDLSTGQNPGTLFITCSDSRIDPLLLTQSRPGDLFVLRTAGNLVPRFGTVHGGEAATIEYAVSLLGVRDIVVCGHSQCGAMTALMDDTNMDSVPAIKAYLQHAEPIRRIMTENYPEVVEPSQRLLLSIKENVLVQLENLLTHPSVASAMVRRQVALHGWVYEFETGQVWSYNSQLDRFALIDEMGSQEGDSQFPHGVVA